MNGPLSSEGQKALLGRIRRKPTQGDIFTREFKPGKPKAGGGHHIRLHRDHGEPVKASGMAHFPGTGPDRTYCKDCTHCHDIEIYRGGRMRKPSNKPGEDVAAPLRVERDACEKAARMMDDMVQKGGIGANRSCKYFEERTDG